MLKQFFLGCLLLFNISSVSATDVDTVIDNFHIAAANADFNGYFDLLADEAIFLGTDGKERWTKEAFKAFVKPYFSQGKGWLYTPSARHITETAAENVVFFDELLENINYGQCRGSGLVIKTAAGWKILQYNLSIPIPNGIAKSIVQQISAHHSSHE